MDLLKAINLKGKEDKEYGGALNYPKKGLYGEEYVRFFRDVKEETKVVVTTGFGLPADGKVPLRLPSLFVPGIKMIENMVKKGHENCSYVIYQTPNLIKEINKIKSPVKKTSDLQKDYINAFLDEACPDKNIREKIEVRFLDDRLKDTELKNVVDNLSVFIKRQHESGNAKYQEMNKILQYGSGHKQSNDSAYQYAAINAIYNQALKFNPLSNGEEGDKVVIPVGGDKERPFFSLTHQIAKDFNNESKVMPMVHQVGFRPSYYPYKDEVCLGEGIPKELPYELKKDYEVLDKAASLKKMAIIGMKLKTLADAKEKKSLQIQQFALKGVSNGY